MKIVYVFLFITLFKTVYSAKFQVLKQWKYVNYTWPSDEVFRTAEAKGLYVPENNVITGIKYHEDYFYLTLPRMKSGVPATLARIPVNKPNDPSPLMEPFPNWEMNNIDDCNNLQSVQNIEIDRKGQMWIIDSGRVQTLNISIVGKCQPKLVIFDIKNNRTTMMFPFPDEVASKNGSYLYDLVLDETDGGYAYITDNSEHDPGIIVFSMKDNKSWKVRHARSMHADLSASQFYVNGISVVSPITIAGIALGPKIHNTNNKVVLNDEREVYFAPIASLHIFSINTTTLRNEMLTKTLNNYDEVIKDLGEKKSQSAAMTMDNHGVLYYSLLSTNAIAQWDSHTPFSSGQKLISQDEKYLEWASSFAFDNSGNLTVIVNRLNKFVFDRLELDQYNFRILSAKIDAKSYLNDDEYSYNTAQEHKTETTKINSTSTTTARPTNSSMITSHSMISSATSQGISSFVIILGLVLKRFC